MAISEDIADLHRQPAKALLQAGHAAMQALPPAKRRIAF